MKIISSLLIIGQAASEYAESEFCNKFGYLPDNYAGTISVAEDGRECIYWSDAGEDDWINDYPDAGLSDHNYCRNPDEDDGAWCLLGENGEYAMCKGVDCVELVVGVVEDVKVTQAATTAATTAATCNPDPTGWSDSYEYGCSDYARKSYCTADGGYGIDWNVYRAGKTFADFEWNGFTGSNCPECGCVEAAPTAVSPCPSSECWTYDESTHTCTMTGTGCASLSCGATGFMITFPSTLYNLDDDQVPATFGGGLSPKWDGSKWGLNVALGKNGMTYNIDTTTDVITFKLPLVMVGNEMKKRTDEIQDNIISLGSQSVVTTPFGAAVIFSCGYDSTINVASQDYTVSGASVVDTFHATGSLADGFAMILNNGAAASFLLGSNLPVAITWSVTALAAKLSFQITDCTVEHGATAIMVAKGGCYASTLDVVSDGTDQAFAFPVFKGTGETDANQLIRCQVNICEVGQCSAPLSCPADGDDKFYNYRV